MLPASYTVLPGPPPRDEVVRRFECLNVRAFWALVDQDLLRRIDL